MALKMNAVIIIGTPRPDFYYYYKDIHIRSLHSQGRHRKEPNTPITFYFRS